MFQKISSSFGSQGSQASVSSNDSLKPDKLNSTTFDTDSKTGQSLVWFFLMSFSSVLYMNSFIIKNQRHWNPSTFIKAKTAVAFCSLNRKYLQSHIHSAKKYFVLFCFVLDTSSIDAPSFPLSPMKILSAISPFHKNSKGEIWKANESVTMECGLRTGGRR